MNNSFAFHFDLWYVPTHFRIRYISTIPLSTMTFSLLRTHYIYFILTSHLLFTLFTLFICIAFILVRTAILTHDLYALIYIPVHGLFR